jgi:CRP/FNR family transcriptional regulator, cyclic AMP receptor protein
MVLLDMLEGLSFLEGLAPEHLRQLASAAELKEFPAGCVVFHEGQSCPWVYVIRQGAVGLEVEAPGPVAVPFQTLGPGELLGWSPLLGPGPMTATARARDRCRLLAINVPKVEALCARDPVFGVELMRRVGRTVARRLHATRLQLLRASQPDPGPAAGRRW